MKGARPRFPLSETERKKGFVRTDGIKNPTEMSAGFRFLPDSDGLDNYFSKDARIKNNKQKRNLFL